MRNEQWTIEQNNEATVRAYKIAVRDGAINLAHNIETSNPQIDWQAIRDKITTEAQQAVANIAADVTEPPETV